MQRMLLTSMVCGAAIAAGVLEFVPRGLMGDDRPPTTVDLEKAETVPGSVPAKESEAGLAVPFPSEPAVHKKGAAKASEQLKSEIVIRTAVPRVIKKQQNLGGGRVVTYDVTHVAYEDKSLPLPANDEEAKELRAELKALREKRIDALSPEDLVKELDAERTHQQEQESWTKLQTLRKQLRALMTEYPETETARVAVEAIRSIPQTDRPVPVASPQPIPGGGSPFSPSPDNSAPVFRAPVRETFPSAPASVNPLPTY